MNQPLFQPIAYSAERWILTATLEAVSALALRTGEEESDSRRREAEDLIEPSPPKKQSTGDAASEDPQVYALDRDCNGRPFVAATALKALLRRLADRHQAEIGAQALIRIFGDTSVGSYFNETEDDKEIAAGGRAEFRNAFECQAAEDKLPPSIRGMTRIDRGTRTAADGSLRHQRVADPETRFGVEIVADGLTEQDATALAALLHLLDGGAQSAVGSGTSKGFGRLQLIDGTVEIKQLGASQIVKWLEDQGGSSASQYAVLMPSLMTSAANLAARWKTVADEDVLRLPLAIDISGYFLVSYAVDKDQARNNERAARAPLPIRQRRADESMAPTRPFLPGASLKGALRAQAERIWRTMKQDFERWEADTDIPTPIAELFGTTGRAGVLIVSDFRGPEMPTVTHEMVAIDRFTGGAADEKKFSVEAFEAPTLAGDLSLRTSGGKFSVEAAGLLALTLRDLCEGDVPVGYGTRKGYGAVHGVSSNGYAPLDALRALLSASPTLFRTDEAKDLLNQCVKALRSAAPDERSLDMG